jgi:hypothetical protein
MYQEEQSFNLRFSLEATFPDDYEGEDDDRVWVQQWEAQVFFRLLSDIRIGRRAFAIEVWRPQTK